MIPTGFIFLDRIPLTPNGKVNRAALMAIREGARVAGGEFVAPRDSTRGCASGHMGRLLGVDGIGVFDNSSTWAVIRCWAGRCLFGSPDSLGVSLPLSALFEAPTVAALARRVDKVRETQLTSRRSSS